MAIERDEGFWRAAYRAHGPVVMGFLVRRLGGRAEAEDLLHETFVRAMQVDTFRGGNLRGYLLRIARNLLINRIRRPRLIVPAQTPTVDAQPFAEVPADDVSPEQATEGQLLGESLGRALAELRPDHRRAFELIVLEQHTYREVVQLTGWSLPRLKSNVHRARKSLIAKLDHLLEDARGARP